MSTPETPEVPQISTLFAQAREMLAEQQIAPEVLDPATVVIATTPPKVLREAAIRGRIDPWARTILIGETPTPEDAHTYADAGAVEDRRMALVTRTRRWLQAAGCVISVALGSAFAYGVGDTQYGLRSEFGGTPILKGSPLFPHNTLVEDPSLHGNEGGLPIIGPVLSRIPTYSPMAWSVTREVDKVTSTKRVVAEAAYSATGLRDPLAPNLTPTGQEFTIGQRTARQILTRYTPKDFSINTVEITGLASNDYAGTLGGRQPAQEQLAEDRAELANEAFVQEAKELGFGLKHQPVLSAHEVVLSRSVIGKIRGLAQRSGQSLKAAVTAYDQGEKLSQPLTEELDTELGDNRGARFKIFGTLKKLKAEKTTKIEHVQSTEFFAEVGSGFAFGIVAIPSILASLLLTAFPDFRRSAQRRAQKLVDEAGLNIES
jgi:hypothetical protein